MTYLSEAAQKLDTMFCDHSIYWRALSEYPNNAAGQRDVGERIDRLSSSIQSYNPQTDFEVLWRDNILSELGNQKMLIDHLEGKKEKNIPNLVDDVLGPGAYEIVEKSFSSASSELHWACNVADIKNSNAHVGFRDYLSSPIFKKYLPVIKSNVLAFAIQNGYFREDENLRVVLTDERSYFDSGTCGISMDSFGFHETSEGGVLNPVDAYLVSFHEMIGHGSHARHSLELPKSLHLSLTNSKNLSQKTISEGIAMMAGEEGFLWLSRNKTILVRAPQEPCAL